MVEFGQKDSTQIRRRRKKIAQRYKEEKVNKKMILSVSICLYPWFISPADDYDKIDYDKMARVTEGLKHVIKDLAGKP